MHIDIMLDSKDEKISKVKKYLEEILSTNVDVILNVLDPRVNHFECFADIENFDTITNRYPEAMVEEDKIKFRSENNRHISFTIYKVEESKKQELINQIQKEFEAQKQKALEDRVIY